MEHTRADQTRILASSVAPHIRKWLAVAQRRKAIFHTVTKFRPTTETPGSMAMGLESGNDKGASSQSVLLISEGWMLAEGADHIVQQLRAASVDETPIIIMAAEPPQGHTPPTYFETNKFTRVFQGMVDTYGVGRYQEANPALFTAITFPFLFGVMYGDIGHDLACLHLDFSWFGTREKLGKRRLGDIGEMIFAGRYMILLMGVFACVHGVHLQ